MDDLISRQAVLNATSTTLKITGKENAETVYEYIKKLCDDIKALPSAQQWIPCSERWPEEYTVVLVSDGEKIGIAYRREYLWYHEEYLGKIAAWMTLPEPYREETES